MNTETGTYVLTVTGTEWLSLNDRGHWSRRNRLTDMWRTSTAWIARAAGLYSPHTPRFQRIHVTAVMVVPDRRRRDPHNYTPTAKACIDGLVDIGVIRDDSTKYLDGPDMRLRINPRMRIPTLELHITPIRQEAAPC